LARNGTNEYIAVIGLGRFGLSVAETLVGHGHEVIAIDSDPALVQSLSSRLPHIVVADCSDRAAVDDLGLSQVDHAVVAIGADMEASVLTVMTLLEAGVTDIWAKATNERHGAILTRLGAHHVSYPEADQGRRVAHLIDGQLSDFLLLSDDFAVAAMPVPPGMAGKTLTELGLRAKQGITVIGFKRKGEPFRYAEADTMLSDCEEIVVSGSADAVRRFSDTVPVRRQG
jgi:trk system potassium uptake protein